MVRLQRAVEKKNSVISPTTILPLLLLCIASVTTLKETLAFCIFFFNLELCFNFVCLREIIAGYDIDESYVYAQHVI